MCEQTCQFVINLYIFGGVSLLNDPVLLFIPQHGNPVYKLDKNDGRKYLMKTQNSNKI